VLFSEIVLSSMVISLVWLLWTSGSVYIENKNQLVIIVNDHFFRTVSETGFIVVAIESKKTKDISIMSKNDVK
jgi:uncharacterized membrane protein YqiK